MITLNCDKCGRSFKTYAAWANKRKRHYCSRKCKDVHHSALYSGKNAYPWRGGRTISQKGYVLLMRKDHGNADKRGYVLEHVYVMSKKLGRPLSRSEVVHHKNHNKTDNRLKNLQVVSPSKHTKLHAADMLGARGLRPRAQKPAIRCRHCREAFVPRWARHEYCSSKCFGLHKRRASLECVMCGSMFWSPNNQHRCCSHSCGAKLGHASRPPRY